MHDVYSPVVFAIPDGSWTTYIVFFKFQLCELDQDQLDLVGVSADHKQMIMDQVDLLKTSVECENLYKLFFYSV